MALDAFPFKGGKPIWNVDRKHWAYLTHLYRKHGLVSGRDWYSDCKSSDERFLDSPHLEWPASDSATTEAAKVWVRRQEWWVGWRIQN